MFLSIGLFRVLLLSLSSRLFRLPLNSRNHLAVRPPLSMRETRPVSGDMKSLALELVIPESMRHPSDDMGSCDTPLTTSSSSKYEPSEKKCLNRSHQSACELQSSHIEKVRQWGWDPRKARTCHSRSNGLNSQNRVRTRSQSQG